MTTENKIEDAEYPLFCVNCKHHSFEEIEKKGTFKITHYCAHPKLVKLANTSDLSSDASACRFKSCIAHQIKYML